MLDISDRIDRVLDRMADTVGWLFILTTIVIAFDVITRKVGYQMPGMGSTKLQELEWHLHTALFSFWLGAAYIHNSHVRIDIAYINSKPRTIVFASAPSTSTLKMTLFTSLRPASRTQASPRVFSLSATSSPSSMASSHTHGATSKSVLILSSMAASSELLMLMNLPALSTQMRASPLATASPSPTTPLCTPAQ